MEVRSDLEVSATRRVCQHASDEQLEELAATSKERRIDPETMTIDEMVALDEEFHLAIAATSGNAERVKVLENINHRIQFVRRITLEQGDRSKEVIREHDDIIAAIQARDTERAIALTEKHLQVNSSNFIDNLQEGLARIYSDVLA